MPLIEGKALAPSGRLSVQRLPEQFTVTVGTVFERSKIPLSQVAGSLRTCWLSKKGMSAHQLHRSLGVPTKPRGSWRTASAKP